jgi:HD-GYP domain-containing protein (c-di-GMP phosphodiesterase class II)
MINDRPYRKRIKKDETLAEIAACAGSQYDPQIAGLFVELAGCE